MIKNKEQSHVKNTFSRILLNCSDKLYWLPCMHGLPWFRAWVSYRNAWHGMCSSCAWGPLCELANCFRQGSTGYDVLSVRAQFSTDHLFGLVWADIDSFGCWEYLTSASRVKHLCVICWQQDYGCLCDPLSTLWPCHLCCSITSLVHYFLKMALNYMHLFIVDVTWLQHFQQQYSG